MESYKNKVSLYNFLSIFEKKDKHNDILQKIPFNNFMPFSELFC